MMLRHISDVLCEVFSITPVMTDGQVDDDPLYSLYARKVSIIRIFTCGHEGIPLCMQLLLTSKKHFSVALWMPVSLICIYPNIFERTWRSMTSSKCILSAIIHKLNFLGHMLIWTYHFLFSMWNPCPNFLHILQLHSCSVTKVQTVNLDLQ
jgi:hypothetical protein